MSIEILKKHLITVDNNQPFIIKDVLVDTKNFRYTITIKSDNMLSSSYTNEIENRFREMYSNLEVLFKYEFDNKVIDKNILLSHLKQYMAKNHNHHQVGIVNNNIIFDVTSNFEQTKIQQEEQKIYEYLATFGVEDYNITYNLLQINNNVEEIKARIEEGQPEVVAIDAKMTKPTNNITMGEAIITKNNINIADILNENNLIINCTLQGEVFHVELRELKNTVLLTMMVRDESGTITVKAFPGFNNKPPTREQLAMIKVGMHVRIQGKKEFDRYAREEAVMAYSIQILETTNELTNRHDNSENKRVELHMHTKMSKNNGISSLDEYAKVAKHFGHKAITITDHDVAQAYVDGDRIKKQYGLDIIYGLEASVVTPNKIIFNEVKQQIVDTTFIVFDVETTGLSANYNKLIELGAVKVVNQEVVARFQCFVKIDEPLSEFTTSLTGITDQDLSEGIQLEEALKRFDEFIQGGVLVAHNAKFDMQFMARNYEKVLNRNWTYPVLDTLELSRLLNQENTFHSLKILAKRYQVPMSRDSHHRADYDAEILKDIFLKMLTHAAEFGINSIEDFNVKNNINRSRGNHNLIYVKNEAGLKDLYQLISDANTIDFLMEAKVLETKLLKVRENLIYVGGGCPKSEIVDSYLNHSDIEFENVIAKFDYVEIMPPHQYEPLINEGSLRDYDHVKEMLQKIVNAATKLNIKVIATGNVHYALPEMAIAKEILYAKDYKADKVKVNEFGDEIFVDKEKFRDWMAKNKNKNTNQYLKTTGEMLEDFAFLTNAEEYVIDNPNSVLETVENIQIIPTELFTPEIEGVDEKLTEMVYEKARSIYGENLPQIVEARIIKEVNAITKYGFSVIYYISHKLVKHSLDAGYLVGSRGSVGSSLVATFMDITEINPLAPHYVCPNCNKSEFITDGSIGSGYDLPLKDCPDCNTLMIRDGQDIPFETFLGFEGDKVPDIDLNFSGEFQSEAHNFVRAKDELNDDELFDFDHAFRAGTIGTIADKTAYAYVKNYFELINDNATIYRSDISYYLRFITGIKRTTGQHPGGIIVVPNHRSIYEFTPIQYPADDRKSPWRTTHFDFHSIHDNLLKLDILGHDDPTMLKKLHDLSGIDPRTVNITDEKVMQLFSTTESLNVTREEIMSNLGTQGVPEFGTQFVMGMLEDTRPSTFAELVQISGLSHGTDVWLGNAKDLIDDGTCVLKEVIGCRDDIMVYLMHKGVEDLKAFNIMESVRKGKGLSEEDIKVLKNNGVADWYIESCLKIKYMFPKAHAAAYVLMALRIAYFKVYHPLYYYAAYFSSRVDDFEVQFMLRGAGAISERIKLIESAPDEYSDAKRKSKLNSLRMCLEMVQRGFKFIPFDLDKSEAFEFIINEEQTGLYLPFYSLDGLGEKEAENIVLERNRAPFLTKEEFKKRTKVKKKSFEQLEYFEVFQDMAEENQMSLF